MKVIKIIMEIVLAVMALYICVTAHDAKTAVEFGVLSVLVLRDEEVM